MRTFLVTVAIAALIGACSPPAQRDADEAQTPQPAAVACNAVAPDASKQVQVEDEAATAEAAAELRGGSIAPGVYDLVRAIRVGAATGWEGTRAATLDIAEDASGAVTFNWASAAPGGEADRWTATFAETPQARLAYTCGRIGEVEAGFTADTNALQLRLPDGANGRLLLDFRRRL